MSTNNKWGALSMRDRAFLIREAVRNGITDINSIRDTWEHRFDGESNQPTEEKPWYKKLASAISEGSRMARDARIGAIGAEQVRELYRDGKTVEAQELAKQYAKANIAGMTMTTGAANTAGLAGDLAITGVSTLADTAVEGNTDNLIQDLGVNAAFDVLGHGTGKIINKIIENTPVVPSNIEDVLKYLKRLDSRGLDKDNLVSMINNASNEELDELLKLTRYSGDWGLIAPLVYIKKGDLRSFAISLSDAMYAMRHGHTPNSKFIEEATNLIKENWNKYIKEGGNNNLRLFGINTELLPAKKYVAHGISTSNFRKAIDRGGEAIMPSFSILPQDTDSKWGDILFLGKKGLLDNTKIYPSDAWTPTVSMVKDINNKTNQQVLDEMMSIQNKREVPQISLEDVDNINWSMEVPVDKVKNQNSFTSWFMDQVPTTSIPGTIPYMEAKYQGNLPFSSFSHMIIPEDAMDAIEWAEKNKMPYSVYGDYNIGDKKKRYPTLQQILNDSDLLFKNGGYINHQFSGEEDHPEHGVQYELKKESIYTPDLNNLFKKFSTAEDAPPTLPKQDLHFEWLRPVDDAIAQGSGFLYDPLFYKKNKILRDKIYNTFYSLDDPDSDINIPEEYEILDREQVRKLLPKRDYIGGKTPKETRDKVASLIPGLVDSLQSISSRHKINPELLHHRISKEGYYDKKASKYNYEIYKDEMPEYWNNVANQEVNGFSELGLDDAGELLEKGLIKVTRPISYETIDATNEKGRNVTSVITPNLWDALEIKAGDIKYRQEEMRKRGVPAEDLDTWTNAAYNLGLYHEDLNNEAWIRKNYTLPSYKNLFKK